MRWRTTPRLLLIFCCLLFVPSARSERLPMKIYTSADGLGSSFVDYLMRDSRGFMWFCTRDGLSRFDGSRFITYRIGDEKAAPGIEQIYESHGGVYWITTTGGLYRFKADALSRPDKSSGGRPFLNAEFVGGGRGPLVEDRAGNIWYASDDLYQIKELNGKFEFQRVPLNLPLKPEHPFSVFQIAEAPDGCIWLITSYGLVRRSIDGRVVLYRHESDVRQGLASFLVEPNGLVWAIWRNDFFVIKPVPVESLTGPLKIEPINPTAVISTSANPVPIPQQPGEVLQLVKENPNTITARLNRSSDGHIWVTDGIYLWEFDGRVFRRNGREQGLVSGMAEMAEDSAGNIWIGGRTGLVRLDRRGLTTYMQADGLSGPDIYAISEAADGSLYFANGNFYLSKFENERFLSVRPQVPPDARALWSSRYAFFSSAREWWILTTGKLYRFAANNLQKPVATYDREHGLGANEAFQIFEDSRGDIWLSQQPNRDEDYGLYRLKKGETEFHRFTSAENLPVGKAASSFAEDRQGNLWFGFYEGGLVRFANNRFEEFDANDGLAGGLIIDLHLDRNGRLWLASTRSGVQRIDDTAAARPAFVSMSSGEGLSSNNARTITEDKLGNIYVGTVRGVDRISPAGRIRHYSVSDGLASDFVIDSHCDQQGRLWFATTNGLSRLIPTAEENQPPPRVFLGALHIAGEEQAVSELGNAALQTGDLAASRNNLQIEFFGLDFRPGETLRYQFKLEGADANWSAPTELRTVTYANLKPGSYRFLVRALTIDGRISEQPAVVTFKILSPLWQRWWFVTLVTLLVLALLYLFYRYRTARLREVNAALAEAKRAEEELGRAREDRLLELQKVRTRIATDLHDDIGSSLTQIAILSEVAQQSMKGNGASMEPLKSIANVSNELVETMSDIVWAINPQKDHMQDLIQRMRRFASDLLPAKGIHFDFEVPEFAPEIPLGANARREVFLIFKESLTNAVKHSKATQLTIGFEFSEDYLTLTIRDNGQGFTPEQGSTAFSDRKGGHGILSMKKRAGEMNARFDITSNGGGTVVTFQLPLDLKLRNQRALAQLGQNRER